MASYGELIRKITTAEINRVQREGGFSRWSYFVDERFGKVGVICANDANFTAYSVSDPADPKLTKLGAEPINDLLLTADADHLIVKSASGQFRALVFSDPLVLVDDDFTDAFTNDVAQAWQSFLLQHGAHAAPQPRRSISSGAVLALAGLVTVVLLAILLLR